jgi:Zn-dependent peptidase ImmA (M78 family)
MKANKGMTLDIGDGHVVISKALMGREEKETVAHELGHCEYGGTYDRYSPYEISSRAEKQASKWAIYRLVPPGEIRAAFKKGVIEPWELAEMFDVSDMFMTKALEYYKLVGVL